MRTNAGTAAIYNDISLSRRASLQFNYHCRFYANANAHFSRHLPLYAALSYDLLCRTILYAFRIKCGGSFLFLFFEAFFDIIFRMLEDYFLAVFFSFYIVCITFIFHYDDMSASF